VNALNCNDCVVLETKYSKSQCIVWYNKLSIAKFLLLIQNCMNDCRLTWGTGKVRVIDLWNFLLRGSTVTIGDTATLLPSNLAARSGEMGCAWERDHS